MSQMDLATELGRIVHERDLDGFIRDEVKQFLEQIKEKECGLTMNQVESNRQVFGSNVLPKVRQKLFIEFVWDAAQDKILIMLAVSAVISLIVHFKNGGWIEGVAILSAVTIVIMVNAVNDWKKDLLFRSLNDKSRADMRTTVIRSGISDLIPVQDLTMFDLIRLEPGNIVPADAILIRETHSLVVDESTATGESKTLTKSLDKDPFFLSGTRITDGSGIALVVAIGESSFHGKLIMAMRSEVELTPLQVQLNDLAEFIAKGGLLLALFLFFALIMKHFRDSDFLPQIPEFIIASITIIVVAVPEGLPMAVTLALAFATNRMLKDNNLVRVLASCETMGRVTSICSDKTGTLTENRMTVVRSQNNQNLTDEARSIICEGLAVNSTAFEIENPETGRFEFVGSATEAALLRFAKDVIDENFSYTLLRRNNQLKKAIPFSSQRKLMISVTGEGRVHLKGAAEIILQKCKKVLTEEGIEREMSEEDLREIRRLVTEMNGDALRTIGQAFARVEADGSLSDERLMALEYCWVNLYGIEDPLRNGVQEAVKKCQNAGIFVRMVTGDNRSTAESIARRSGILMSGGLVMEGPEFRSLSTSQLIPKLSKLQVLARSSPLDKQRLVRLLKREVGEIVAVTGDGSNDGPALKAADVGFSMGITGTQLAQEASSIVLLDDNFASIVKAVSWGRCITRSVRKFLQFQLTVNVGAVITASITALWSKMSVLTAVQMLWVNLMMDSMGALALATDLPTDDLLQVPPEKPGSPLITRPMKIQILFQSLLQLTLCLGIFFGASRKSFDSDAELRTFIFNLFVFLQLFNELNCRSLTGDWKQMIDIKNYLFWMIWMGSVAGQVLIVEFGGSAFGTEKLSWELWLLSIALASLSIPLGLLIYKFGRNSDLSTFSSIHPTREQLAWQSAIHHVRTRARFYSAIRRKLSAKDEVVKDFIDEEEKEEIDTSSPKSTDTLLI